MKSEIVKVYISPSKGNNEISSWEDKIKENYSPLSGYAVDLEKSSINDILLSILQLNKGGIKSNQNYWNIKNLYLEHIKSLQKNLEEENDTLKQEIDILKATSPSSKTVDILLKYGILSGIEFFIPYEKVYRGYEDIMGNDVFIGTNSESLYKKYYEGLICDADYIPNKIVPFKYFDLKLAVQVIIYSKAKFKAYDVTNFISNVQTSVAKGSGGNFQIKMHLISQKELETNSHFQDNNINITGYTKALFLQSIFRENDLVFIRFEKLKVENYEEKSENNNSSTSDSDAYVAKKRNRNRNNNSNKIIKGRYWDIIGLIDTTTIISDYNSLDINISGRDLIKLLIEDNNFFIPYQFANCPETIFGGQNTKIFKRLFATGEYNLEFIKSYKSIENSIGFILSQLTNIQVLSNDCLDFLKNEYGDDLSKQFEYTQAGKEEKKEIIRGIWGLVNYVVDEKITHYRLADSSLKSPDGSIMQQILKICQEPFVEIIADTFVDKYSLIIRRPPFTIKDIYNSKFIVIGRDCSISDNLTFSREIYTVYQLTPPGGCFVDDSSIPLGYLPMIVLDEYTKLWGNKSYFQIYNYINIDAYNKIEKENQKSIKETFIDDLIWLIESTAYLPFSRQGTINIKGDRRIKIGQWIYYEKTNEVYYVDGVTHSANVEGGKIDRITTLTVSRGLVKDYIIPPKKNSSSVKNKTEVQIANMSYGDLIDINLLREGLKELTIKMNNQFNLQREVKEGDTFQSTTSIVVKEVFNFFLSGAQFEGEVMPYVLYYDKAALDLNSINQIQGQGKNGNNEGAYSLNINVENDGGNSGKIGNNSNSNSINKQKSTKKSRVIRKGGIENQTLIFD